MIVAVGTPRDDDHRGIVNVVYGASTGRNFGASQACTQDGPGIADAAESDDRFGAGMC